MRIIFLLITSISLTIYSSAQDLTGTWVRTSGGSVDYAEICIIGSGNTYIGYTYDVGSGHCKCNFLGQFNTEKKKLKGMNKGVIEKTFLHGQSRYNLNYVTINGEEYLRGMITAKTVGTKLMSFGLPMFITYRRSNKQVDTTAYMTDWFAKNPEVVNDTADLAFEPEPVPVTETPATITTAATIAAADTIKTSLTADSIITEKNKRSTDTLSVINTSEKELVIKVMDNGIVDGDIVSIIHNGKVIAERIAVTTVPYELKIPTGTGNEQQEIVLVAHNTGTITPNTALIVIDTPSKQYRLTASTDLSKNAMIIFRYKE